MNGPSPSTYSITLTLSHSPTHVSAVALVKRFPTLESTLAISSQVHVVNLFASPETISRELYNVVSGALKPWLDLYASKTSSPLDENRPGLLISFFEAAVLIVFLGFSLAQKKMSELELSLLQLHDNDDIPEIYLKIHPIIKQAVATASHSGIRPTMSLLPHALLNDTKFLNQLQAHVNQWIRSIQAVTKLNREVSSGTALQEINFWLHLESVLDSVEAQLRSDEVAMVMDCLRNAKRFHATVSFIADTGLKTATDTGG